MLYANNLTAPQVVAEIVLPWFTQVTEVSLNPLSVTQMTTCRGILEQLRMFDLAEKQVAPLCMAVVKATVKWVGSICVPVIKMAQGGSSRQLFVREQLDRLSLILENLFIFVGVISATALAKVAWTALQSQGRGAMVKLLAGGTVLSDNEVR